MESDSQFFCSSTWLQSKQFVCVGCVNEVVWSVSTTLYEVELAAFSSILKRKSNTMHLVHFEFDHLSNITRYVLRSFVQAQVNLLNGEKTQLSQQSFVVCKFFSAKISELQELHAMHSDYMLYVGIIFI